MYRIGHSRDIHKFGPDRDLVLGGVKIPFDLGLVAHSDGDCLIHAIVESIIGAMGLGDIGKHFPDTDPQYKNYDSKLFLGKVKQMLKDNNYEIVNIDATIMAEKPMMAPHIPLMKKVIAKELEVNENQVNIKATRGEGLGFVGEGKGIECDSIVLIQSTKPLVKKL